MRNFQVIYFFLASWLVTIPQTTYAWSLFDNCLDELQELSQDYNSCQPLRELTSDCVQLLVETQKKELECQKEGYSERQISASIALAYSAPKMGGLSTIYDRTQAYLASQKFITSALISDSDFFSYSPSNCKIARGTYYQFVGYLVNDNGMVFYELENPKCVSNYQELVVSSETISKLRVANPTKKFLTVDNYQQALQVLKEDDFVNREYKVEIRSLDNQTLYKTFNLTMGTYLLDLDVRGFIPQTIEVDVLDSDQVVNVELTQHRIICNGQDEFKVNLNLPLENISSRGKCRLNFEPKWYESPRSILLAYELISNYPDKRLISIETRVKFRFKNDTRVIGSSNETLSVVPPRMINAARFIPDEVKYSPDDREIVISFDIISAHFE